MARVVVFFVFTSLVVVMLALQKNKNLPIDNNSFNYQEYKKAHEGKLETISKLKKEQWEKKHKKAEEVVEEEPAGPVVVLETDSEKRGAELYAKKCKVCHGKNAEGKKSQNAPRLAGQYDWYVLSQLEAMKAGKRVNKVMMPYIKKLSSADFKDLSAYLAKYTW